MTVLDGRDSAYTLAFMGGMKGRHIKYKILTICIESAVSLASEHFF